MSTKVKAALRSGYSGRMPAWHAVHLKNPEEGMTPVCQNMLRKPLLMCRYKGDAHGAEKAPAQEPAPATGTRRAQSSRRPLVRRRRSRPTQLSQSRVLTEKEMETIELGGALD